MRSRAGEAVAGLGGARGRSHGVGAKRCDGARRHRAALARAGLRRRNPGRAATGRQRTLRRTGLQTSPRTTREVVTIRRGPRRRWAYSGCRCPSVSMVFRAWASDWPRWMLALLHDQVATCADDHLRRSLATAPWEGRASRAAPLPPWSYTTSGDTIFRIAAARPQVSKRPTQVAATNRGQAPE
jgi:hypothetical protein